MIPQDSLGCVQPSRHSEASTNHQHMQKGSAAAQVAALDAIHVVLVYCGTSVHELLSMIPVINGLDKN